MYVQCMFTRFICQFLFLGMHVCVHVYMYTCMYLCMHVCMYVCMYVFMYLCMYVCMCMYVCTYVRTNECVCACMYVRHVRMTHIQTNIQYDTHTNKHTVMSGECDIDASDAEVRSARFHVLLACMYVCMCAYMHA